MLFDINRQYHSPRHPRRYPSIVQQLADGKLDSAAIFQRDLSYLAQDEERKQKRLLLLHDERYESHKASETENDVMAFAYQVDEAILALRTNNEDFRLGPPLERNISEGVRFFGDLKASGLLTEQHIRLSLPDESMSDLARTYGKVLEWKERFSSTIDEYTAKISHVLPSSETQTRVDEAVNTESKTTLYSTEDCIPQVIKFGTWFKGHEDLNQESSIHPSFSSVMSSEEISRRRRRIPPKSVRETLGLSVLEARQLAENGAFDDMNFEEDDFSDAEDFEFPSFEHDSNLVQPDMLNSSESHSSSHSQSPSSTSLGSRLRRLSSMNRNAPLRRRSNDGELPENPGSVLSSLLGLLGLQFGGNRDSRNRTQILENLHPSSDGESSDDDTSEPNTQGVVSSVENDNNDSSSAAPSLLRRRTGHDNPEEGSADLRCAQS